MINVTVNGNTAPAPTKLAVTLNPLQKTAERNGNGLLVRETLPDKWSVELEWEFGNMTDFYAWWNTLSGLTRSYFDVSFPAPSGNIETKHMYISPISAEMLSYMGGTSGWWKTLKTSFVEV